MAKYHRGANFERECIKEDLKQKHCVLALRGAGSKSYSDKGIKADTLSIFSESPVTLGDLLRNYGPDQTVGIVLVRQCKKGKASLTKEAKRFSKSCTKLPVIALLTTEFKVRRT